MRSSAKEKPTSFPDLTGTVVEIGAGNGVNFPYYPKDVKIAAYEPNPHMHKASHCCRE